MDVVQTVFFTCWFYRDLIGIFLGATRASYINEQI